MTPKQRFLAVLAGERPDTVPIIPVIDGYFAPKVIGRRNDECYMESGCMADALLTSMRRFGYDGVLTEMGLGSQPGVLGCPVEVEGNDVPLVVDTLVGGREDLEKVPVPDPWSDGKMEQVETLVREAGEEHVVIGSVRSPFEYAATIRGLMEFMTDFYRDPQFVHDLIATARPATIAVARAMIDAGVDGLVIKDSFASSSMISPDHYSEFAFPSEADVIGELAGEVPVILHICRNSLPILPQMARTGAAVLELDSPVDLRQARAAIGPDLVIKGNLDAVSMMEKGSVKEVEEAVRAAMEAEKDGGRFILSTGDSIPLPAPEENVSALVENGRRYGRY